MVCTSSSRVVNSKIPYTLTLSLPFPVVRNQDLDHTIKPRHWSRPFTPHFRPSDRGKFLVETVIFAWPGARVGDGFPGLERPHHPTIHADVRVVGCGQDFPTTRC